MKIVNDAYLISEFGLTKRFIDTHGPKWGCFSTPRKHILSRVEDYICSLSDAKRKKYNTPKYSLAQEKIVRDIVNEIFYKRQRKKEVANG